MKNNQTQSEFKRCAMRGSKSFERSTKDGSEERPKDNLPSKMED